MSALNRDETVNNWNIDEPRIIGVFSFISFLVLAIDYFYKFLANTTPEIPYLLLLITLFSFVFKEYYRSEYLKTMISIFIWTPTIILAVIWVLILLEGYNKVDFVSQFINNNSRLIYVMLAICYLIIGSLLLIRFIKYGKLKKQN